jgi:hypothetical protein
MLQFPLPGAPTVGVFFIGKNKVVKIAHSSFEVVLRTTKHIMIYLSSGPSLEVIALRPTVIPYIYSTCLWHPMSLIHMIKLITCLGGNISCWGSKSGIEFQSSRV